VVVGAKWTKNGKLAEKRGIVEGLGAPKGPKAGKWLCNREEDTSDSSKMVHNICLMIILPQILLKIHNFQPRPFL
jgi:hypothetical protein